MSKRALKVGGFIGSVAVTAALVGAAASGTGAYFTDAKDGNIKGTSGKLKISNSETFLNFEGLMPGVDRTEAITFEAQSGSANVDVWLTFDTTSKAYGAFTGAKGVDYAGHTAGGLGGYGHFKVVSGQGHSFESYNLQHKGTGVGSECLVSADTGNGGSSQKATGPDNANDSAPYCGVPGAIKVASNLSPGITGHVDVTFGLTGKAQTQEVAWVDLPYKLVATQVGVMPGAAHF